MSRRESEAMGLIDNQMAIDDLRQLALEASERLTGRLVPGELALVVVAPRTSVHRLDAGREVERVVERAVAGPGQAVPGDLATRDLDRRGARVAREAIGRREATDVTDMAQDLGRQDVADAE